MAEQMQKTFLMQMFEIARVVEESASNRTFYLKKYIECLPGQFLMVWIPGVDEKPFSLMNAGKKSAINIELKGTWSRKFFELNAGQKIGIRGPFGNPFDFRGVKRACIVAGGVGVVPLVPLALELEKAGTHTTFVLGAQTKKKLLFENRIKKIVSKLVVTTDDGSQGRKGFVTNALEELLKNRKFDCVFTCGPEQMMHAVFLLCKKNNTPVQASLERFMKCGFGVCGACMVNDRIACVDGPVFGSEKLERMDEFGKTAYLKSGKKCGLNDFYRWRSV